MLRTILFLVLLVAVYSSMQQDGNSLDLRTQLANLLMQRRNTSVDPCDNFYQYACGNSSSVQPKSTRTTDRARIMKQIREILEMQPDGMELKSVSVERQLYKVCRASASSIAEEKLKFLSLLESTGGLSIITTENVTAFSKSWQEIDKIYTKLGFKGAFFDIQRTVIEGNTNILMISPPMWRKNTTAVISSVYSFDLKNWSSMINEAFETNAPSSNETSVNIGPKIPLDAMMAFGQELDKIIAEVEDNEDLLFSSNKMSICKWQKEYDRIETSEDTSKINWMDFIQNVVSTADIDVGATEPVMIVATEYFNKMADILERTPKDIITTWVHLNFIYKIYQKALWDDFDHTKPLWWLCLSSSDLVGTWHEFLSRHQLQENRKLADQVMNDIKNYIINEARMNWMDESGKRKIDRISKFQAIIGYPEWMHDRSIVDHYYDRLNVTTSGLQNLINVAQFNKKTHFMKLRKPEIPEPFDVRFFFNNRAGIILEKDQMVYSSKYLMNSIYGLFDAKYPRGINYGALGSEFGQVWWNSLYREGGANHDIKYVENKKCFGKKRDTNQIPGKVETMDRDTFLQKMDLGNSVQSTFNAYSNHSDDGNKLPGLEDLTDHQLFFLAYANNVCTTGLDGNVQLYVNQIVSNMKEFSTAFKCSEKSAMNLEIKCYKS